ncbi:MAG TPA: hypothetical protein VFJ06_06755 [Halococcus sp.]|nr:hypothetical protein [Halococcus sp.]
MAAGTLVQVSPAAGGPLAYLGTFLLTAGIYSLTVHIAARNVLGSVPLRRALLVGPVLAAVSLLLQQFGVLTFVLTVAVDFVLVRYVYRLRIQTTALVTFIHIIVSILVLAVVLSAYQLLALGPLA